MTFLGEWRLKDPNWRHDDTCTLIGGDMVQGAEDLAIWKHGVAIVSAGDLHTAFTQDPALTQNTGAFAVDITKPGHTHSTASSLYQCLVASLSLLLCVAHLPPVIH